MLDALVANLDRHHENWGIVVDPSGLLPTELAPTFDHASSLGDEGCADGAVIGTSWHGLLEDDRYRAALLGWVAQQRGLAFTPAGGSFAAAREARLDRLGDLVEAHLDLDAIERLIVHGPPRGLPTVELRTA